MPRLGQTTHTVIIFYVNVSPHKVSWVRSNASLFPRGWSDELDETFYTCRCSVELPWHPRLIETYNARVVPQVYCCPNKLNNHNRLRLQLYYITRASLVVRFNQYDKLKKSDCLFGRAHRSYKTLKLYIRLGSGLPLFALSDLTMKQTTAI